MKTRLQRLRDLRERVELAILEITEHCVVTKNVTFDFESLYKKYPRKQGKGAGLKKCASQIKSQKDFDLLSTAIDNFSSYMRDSGRDIELIPYFSTFMTNWRDWLDPEIYKPVKKSNHFQSQFERIQNGEL